LHTAECRSKTRRVCARVAWVQCTWPMYVTQTATSSAQSVASRRMVDQVCRPGGVFKSTLVRSAA
jgi:hypothetical protein